MTALTIYLFVVVPKSFMPAVDVPYFSGTLEASQDNSFDRMIAYGEEVNKLLATIPWMESNLSGVEIAELRLVLGQPCLQTGTGQT